LKILNKDFQGVYNISSTFVIFGEDRKKFSYKPEEFLVNKQVCVTREIKAFRDKPQIIVSETTQVVIK
jgi:hypothetical protein